MRWWMVLATALENKKEASILARATLESSIFGELGTVVASPNHQVDGYPYVSVEYIADDCPSTGHPFFALVSWGNHAQNLNANPKASLFVRDATWYHDEKPNRGRMDHLRFTLLGKARKVSADEREHFEDCFRQRIPDLRWKSGHSFEFYQLHVEQVSFVGGFGDEHFVGWVDINEYLKPKPILFKNQ